MWTRIVGVFGALLLIVVASCGFPSSDAPSCDDDVELCPRSSAAATAVTCDCHCTLGAGGVGTSFDGPVPVCLPPELNASTASEAQRVTRHALSGRELDQSIYRYCSGEVARYVRAAFRLHLRLAACLQPLACECSTQGTRRDSPACRSPCAETACDNRNCPSVTENGSEIEMSACSCTRASACGVVSPEEGRPGVCRDWVAPTETPLL